MLFQVQKGEQQQKTHNIQLIVAVLEKELHVKSLRTTSYRVFDIATPVCILIRKRQQQIKTAAIYIKKITYTLRFP